MALPPVTTGMAVVFGLILLALVLFVTEIIPPDMTAVGVLVALAVLEPLTGVSAADAIRGFASPATVTILAMYILSEGVQRTGVVDRLGLYLARVTHGDESRLLAATVGTTGLSAGIVNNTPVVAVFIPMVTGLAERAGLSPSKLLLPLSYAAMLGGTLTLIGTATNILASDLAAQLLQRGPIGMFEFTPLGLLVLAVGAAYLLTVGHRLTPARVKPETDLTEQFDLENRLARLAVPEGSSFVGQRVGDLQAALEEAVETPVDLLQIDRDGERVDALTSDRAIEPGDVLTVRASLQAVNRIGERLALRQLAREEVTDEDLVTPTSTLAGVTVQAESRLIDQTVAESRLEERFDTRVLAVLRSGEVLRNGLDTVAFEPGDTLLLYTTRDGLNHLRERRHVTVASLPSGALEILDPGADEATVAPLSPKTPVALGVMAAVIGLAALGLVPIVIAALGGVFAMVVTGCLDTAEAYDAVSWNVVFLLAGVLPLGLAMQRTGGAEFVAAALVASADLLPTLALLGLFYVLTGLLANIITPVASVVLMIPVAVDTAGRVGGEPFSFLLAVTFAASSAFMTPVGYQTNLMVYGPGGYRFTDYVRVGGPLQLLLAVVVPLGIAVLFGV